MLHLEMAEADLRSFPSKEMLSLNALDYIDICFMGLSYLNTMIEMIALAVFNEIGSCLHEMEADASLCALPADVEHPLIIAGPGI